MTIGVYRIYLSQVWADPDVRARLVQALDGLPTFFYRIDQVNEADLAAAGNDAAARDSIFRVALTQAHVALLPADVPAIGETDASPHSIEITLARTGFRRRIPVLAVLAPGQREAAGQSMAGADRLVAFDGALIASAIQELAEVAVAERRARDLTRRPRNEAMASPLTAKPKLSCAGRDQDTAQRRPLPFAEIAEAFRNLQTVRGNRKPAP